MIGITSYAQPARWGAWELPAALVPYHYVESVERAGGRALVVPPTVDGGPGNSDDLFRSNYAIHQVNQASFSTPGFENVFP